MFRRERSTKGNLLFWARVDEEAARSALGSGTSPAVLPEMPGILVQARRLATLIGAPQDFASHPAAEMLATYFDAALDAPQMASVRRHIRDCRRCTTDLEIL